MDLGIVIDYTDLVGVYFVFIALKDILDKFKSNRTGELNVSRVAVFAPITKESQEIRNVRVVEVEDQIF